ncbi:hypothetical protein JX265_001705 [Neoarthrinium moseri]|uniref:Zn(2)-C6 fungal-type domain-containing protein n=1 Tax=Neoarthrinium moseri TaxID=1658444 RepID=A0A9Q0ATJ9_9PEZI|nr:hypothetical protein JX266_010845 [Neoarthrinium moseri]KAI1880084.1 hypothetical protein JX265_001705 [Neoarthrinium moseri]
MENDTRPVPGRPAPYGQACIHCVKAKCKCISRANTGCERCSRRGLECRPSDGVRKRNTRKATSANRTSQLEERLNDLVTLLRSQQSIPGSSVKEPVPSSQPSHYASASTWSPSRGPDAYLTPSTAISSTSHVDCNQSSLIYDDELSPFEAEKVLQTFRNDYLKFFPFVWIKPDATAQELQRYRPFLWLNIRTVCEKSTAKMHILGDRAREIFARKVLVELERDMDTLLGLMVYLGWSTYQSRGKGFLARYANIANSLIQDLRLDQSPSTNCHSNCWVTVSKIPVVPEQTNEQRRVLIANFILCSTISFFLRLDVVRWNPYMEQSLERLAAQPEYEGDEVLVAIARAKLIVEEVANVSWRRTDYEASGPPLRYVKPLRNRLEQLRKSLSPEVAQNKIVMSHLNNAEVLIYEIAIFHPTSPITMPNPSSTYSAIPIPPLNLLPDHPEPTLSAPFKPVDICRLENLHNCLQSVKVSLSSYFGFTAQEYVTFPFAAMCHLSHSVQVLYRLSTLEEPDWDRAAVRREADIIAVLNEVADKMGQVASAAGLISDPSLPCGDIFSRGAGTLRTTASIWAAALAQQDETTGIEATQLPPADGCNDMGENPTDSIPILDFENDPWLTDLFASWEGAP